MTAENRNRICGAAVLLCLLAYYFYKVRFGMYHDEPSVVIYAKLFAQGQRSITQVWDIIQMSGWIAYPFTQLFYALTGRYEGIILYMRFVYLLIHFCLAIYVWFTLSKIWDMRRAFFAALFSFVFVYHFYTICYKSTLYWGTLLSVLFLLRLTQTGKRRFVVFAAFAFSAAVLCFPTVVILVIPFSLFLYRQTEHGKQHLLLFWGVCLLCAVLLVLWVWSNLSGLSFGELWNAYTKAASDSDHGTPLKLLRRFGTMMAVFLGANLTSFLYRKWGRFRRLFRNLFRFLTVLFWCLIAGVIAVRYFKLSVSLFWCAFCALFFVAESLLRHGELDGAHMSLIRSLFMNVSVWLLIAITLATNVGIAVIAYGAVFGMLGLVLVLQDPENRQKKDARILTGSILFVHLCSAMFFTIEYNTQERTTHIFSPHVLCEKGPGRGLYFNDVTMREYQEAYEITNKYVAETERVCMISDHFRRAVCMLSTNAQEVAHAAFEYETDTELLSSWCDAFPADMPTVVLVDEEFLKKHGGGGYEQWIEQAPFGVYLREHYDTEHAIRDDNWVILRRG